MGGQADPVAAFKDGVLEGRVAVVTGGGSGIGFEVGRQLGVFGAKVVIMGRRQHVLDEALDTLRRDSRISCSALAGDVRSPQAAASLVAHVMATYGSLDILVNAAAGNFLVPAEDLSTNGFRTVMDIDAVGCFNMCRAAFPELRKSRWGGRVVNVSATLHYGATWWQVHASAAKAAIDSITRSLALEWAEYGIRVNGLAPGPIADTPGLQKLSGGAASSISSGIGAIVPLGTLGTKKDMAAAVLFLVSDAGAFVTGHTLVSDGAEWMNKPRLLDRDAVREFSREYERRRKSAAAGMASKL